MHHQNRCADLESHRPSLGVAVVADDLKAALLRPFLAVSHAPSDPGVQRLLDDIKRDRVKPHEHLARILVCARRDGARRADLVALATKILAFFGDDEPTPPASAFPVLTVEETAAQGKTDARQVVLSPSSSLGDLYAVEEDLEAEITAKRKLLACVRGMRLAKYGQSVAARDRLNLRRA